MPTKTMFLDELVGIPEIGAAFWNEGEAYVWTLCPLCGNHPTAINLTTCEIDASLTEELLDIPSGPKDRIPIPELFVAIIAIKHSVAAQLAMPPPHCGDYN